MSLTLIHHQKRLRMLARGDRRCLPSKSIGPTVAIAEGVKYVGYQIAFTFIGWIIIAALVILACFAITILIGEGVERDQRDERPLPPKQGWE